MDPHIPSLGLVSPMWVDVLTLITDPSDISFPIRKLRKETWLGLRVMEETQA